MKNKIIYLLVFLSLFLITGCSSVSLNKEQQEQFISYIDNSNKLIEELLSKDQNRRIRLQPHRTRYRLVNQIINDKFYK